MNYLVLYNCRLNGGEFFLLNAQVLNYECKCVHVHNLDLKLSTLFIETTSIGREFHILAKMIVDIGIEIGNEPLTVAASH